MAHLDLGDVSIHYEEAGSGSPALVFCPGLDARAGREFASQFELWREHFGRVLTWDPRGLGGSSAAKKYSLPLYASDLARLMDKLRIERAVVMGMLWGGIVSLQFALDYPEKCAGLILDSTSSEVNLRVSEEWYRRGEAAKEDPNISPEQRESHVAASRSVAGLREHPLTPRLKNITCPVLVVAGILANTNRRDVASGIMVANLPNATLHLLDDVGPGIFRQQPEQFMALAVEFCKAHGIIAP